MKLVFVLNGYPTCGKDTFIEILRKYKKVDSYSAIDRVKEIALLCGWDGVKDDKGRKLLADLKTALKDYDNIPFRYLCERYELFLNGTDDILILQTREQDEIDLLKREFGIKSIFIRNNRISNVVSNQNDASIPTEGYDYYIDNNGSLKEYEDNILEFLKSINN